MSKERGELVNPILLGQGGFAKVYRITEQRTGTFLVCKVSGQEELVEQEREVLRKIKHPLFPRYIGWGTYQNRNYLLMEYIEGMSLKLYVQKRGGLSKQRTTEIAGKLAEGLCYLHEQSERMIYRDIKPENVLIQSDGRVRLVDLGCVYIEGRYGCGLAGSRGYAAPEQFDKQKKIGEESDVYGLGKLMYFMLTGCNIPESSAKKLYYPPGKRPDRKLKWLIGQAVQEEQQSRIPDMRTFLQYLELYEKHAWGKQLFHRRGKTLRQMGGAAFYFQENIRKGR